MFSNMDQSLVLRKVLETIPEEGVRMAFSPNESKQTGGGLLVLAFSEETPLRPDAEYFIAFEGRAWRHLVTAKRVNALTFHSHIPEHRDVDSVRLSLLMSRDANTKVLASSTFKYIPEPAQTFAEFLLGSVYDPKSLDNFDRLKVEFKEVFREELSVVDKKVCKFLARAAMPENWNMLGVDSNTTVLEPKETLLHLCGRLGLRWTAQYLLSLPGGTKARDLPNKHDDTPGDVCNMYGHLDMAEMFNGRPPAWKGDPPWRDAHSLEKAGPPTRIRRVDRDLFALTTNLKLTNSSLHDDLALMQEVVTARRPPTQSVPRHSPRSFSVAEGTVTSKAAYRSRSKSGVSSSQDGVIQESISDDSQEEDSAFPGNQGNGSHGNHRSHRHVQSSHLSYGSSRQPQISPQYSQNKHSGSVTVDTSLSPTYVNLDSSTTESVVMDTTPMNTHIQGASSSHWSASAVSVGEWNTPVLEESLKKLHEIHTSLQQKLGASPDRSTDHENSRKENLNRFSTSCPSIPDSLVTTPVLSEPPNQDTGHYNSLSNLVSDEPRPLSLLAAMPDGIHQNLITNHSTHILGPADNDLGLTMNASSWGSPTDPPSTQHAHRQEVKIIINDVTLDSSEDYMPVVPASASLTDNDSTDLIEQIRRATRRRSSWCPEEGRKKEEKQEKQKMLNVCGRSQSLSSLDGDSDEDEDEEEEEDEAPYQESPPEVPSGSPGRYGARTGRSPNNSTDGHLPGPVTHPPTSSTPLSTRPDGSVSSMATACPVVDGYPSPGPMDYVQVVSDMSPANTEQNAQPGNVSPTGNTHSPPHDPRNHGNIQGLMYTNSVIKPPSSSTSPHIVTGRHDNKEIQTLADFQEQSHTMTGHGLEDEARGEMDSGGEWFRGQPPAAPLDITDLCTPNDEEEEKPKKRKTSVFSKFGSYRQKKVVSKDAKSLRNSHHFVFVSCSNATSCDVCGKSMANKAALQCENCMVNVHEIACKDQITPCAKYRHTRNGDSIKDKSSSLPESVTLNVNIKSSQSMKERRSVSVPARPVLQVSSSTSALPRSSSPSGTNGAPVGSSGHFQWRRVANRLGIDRVINEERDKVKEEEAPPVVQSMQLLDTTNITDTLSVSLESLEEGVTEPVELEEDIEVEPEAWSVTVDKKTLKKMHAKDIKRQDHIWELIQTERSHCRTLKIMQKFSRGMREEVGLSQDMIDRVFPRLNDLQGIHATFLHRLTDRQKLRADKSIEDVGDLLIDQFDGELGDQLRKAYGDFCSRHAMAVQLYKDLLKSERKFQNFIKKCSRSALCRRLSIPEYILLVTQRITKYPLLIEPIIKTTKDNKVDRDRLTRALALMREVLNFIDTQVDAHEKEQRLIEIYNKLDARSYAWYIGDKFKKSNLLGNRKLTHEGYMKWMTARGKSFEVLAVILSDVIFFLAENNQKYSFFSQDSKSSVVPLSKLLVREKGDTKDSKGIYLICQSKTEPEMYEFVCRSAEERKAWIKTIKKAIMNCMEVEGATIQSGVELEGDRKELEAKSARIRQLVDRLYQKDSMIRNSCDEKMSLIFEMLEVFCREDISKNIDSLYREEDGPEAIDQEVLNTLKATLEEGSHFLSSLVPCGALASVGRSTSSVGEKKHGATVAPSLPKRAETFSGFDQREKVKKRYNSGHLEEADSGSDGQLNETDAGAVISKEAPPTTDNGRRSIFRRASLSLSTLLEYRKTSAKEKSSKTSSSFLHTLIKSHTDKDPDADTHSKGAVDAEQITANNMAAAAGMLTAPSREQCESLAQLMQYLHGLVCITSHQVTEVEKFRAQLSEANSKVSHLYAENKRLSHGFHHDKQLEILREQQEMIRQEHSELDKRKEREQRQSSAERSDLDRFKEEIEKQKAELKAQKEEIQHQKEVLQRQMDLFEEKCRRQMQAEGAKAALGTGLRERSESPVSRGVSPSSRSISQSSLIESTHKRSASEDLTKQGSPERSVTDQGSGSLKEALNKSRSGTSGPQTAPAPRGSALPIHLLSATNEQKVGQISQQLPLKLAGLSSGGKSPSSGTLTAQPPPQSKAQTSSLHQMFPTKLSGSQSSSQLPQKQSFSGLPTNTSPRMSGSLVGKSATLDGASRSVTSTQRSTVSRSSSSVKVTSGTGNILPMKLAEKPRPKSASAASSAPMATASGSPSATTSESPHSHKKSSNITSQHEEIYF